MHSLEAITKVEDRYSGPKGQPSLGEAFDMPQARWASGARDRETCLRLAFLAWYSCAEPNGYTGLPQDQELTSAIFSDALAALGGEQSEGFPPGDPETGVIPAQAAGGPALGEVSDFEEGHLKRIVAGADGVASF